MDYFYMPDKEVRERSYLLFQLYMDFMCWKDCRDDIVKKSAVQIVKWIEDNKAGSG